MPDLILPPRFNIPPEGGPLEEAMRRTAEKATELLEEFAAAYLTITKVPPDKAVLIQEIRNDRVVWYFTTKSRAYLTKLAERIAEEAISHLTPLGEQREVIDEQSADVRGGIVRAVLAVMGAEPEQKAEEPEPTTGQEG